MQQQQQYSQNAMFAGGKQQQPQMKQGVPFYGGQASAQQNQARMQPAFGGAGGYGAS
jgi:hypothetical protein